MIFQYASLLLVLGIAITACVLLQGKLSYAEPFNGKLECDYRVKAEEGGSFGRPSHCVDKCVHIDQVTPCSKKYMDACVKMVKFPHNIRWIGDNTPTEYCAMKYNQALK
ncbi:hypothetical protein TetV_082 [Tetraselmis virus 1]|uniref:Uncharacterized protein n=1 Tax=Tetraselmis virus 1 TaxID=2060617 RepID=A0A2P0VMP7_9VIRU|nr:hypothetical protein QJ968_gp082 [Tetraselmis virus 1]AUF82174.1 hypothetical protein TetV_082 [Tetraselmis virus 1]